MKAPRKTRLDDLVSLRDAQGLHNETAVLLLENLLKNQTRRLPVEQSDGTASRAATRPKRLAAQLAARAGTKAPDGPTRQRNFLVTPVRANDKPASLTDGHR